MTTTYTYDAAGNMLEKVTNGSRIEMTYGAANELRTMSGVGGTIRYGYDANGNMVQKTLGTMTDSYTYNVNNQLTEYRGYDGYRQRYTYNAQGHMTKRESSGNGNRKTLEAIVRGDEQKRAAGDGDGERK